MTTMSLTGECSVSLSPPLRSNEKARACQSHFDCVRSKHTRLLVDL